MLVIFVLHQLDWELHSAPTWVSANSDSVVFIRLGRRSLVPSVLNESRLGNIRLGSAALPDFGYRPDPASPGLLHAAFLPSVRNPSTTPPRASTGSRMPSMSTPISIRSTPSATMRACGSCLYLTLRGQTVPQHTGAASAPSLWVRSPAAIASGTAPAAFAASVADFIKGNW